MESNNWQILLDILTRQSQSRLPNIKNTDPVGFCLDNKDIREILNRYIDDFLQYQNKHKKFKDAKIAEEKREEGDREFKSEKFERTCAKRSSVLYHLNQFEESCNDIELALNHGYPGNDSAELMLRMGKCLVHLGRTQAARTVFNDLLNNLEDKCKNNLEYCKKQVEEEIAKLSKVENDSNRRCFKLPELKNGENANFVSASNSLSVIYSKIKGRHVVARNDIKVGDVLFVEKPFALVALKEVCENCCAATIAPVPCWSCLSVKYCSEFCRDKSWDEFHKFECGFHEFLKSVGIAHLGLRVALAAAPSFNQLKKILKKVKYKEQENSVNFKSPGYENVYNLVTNMSALQPGDLFQYALTASLLSMYLQRHTNYFPTRDDKTLKQFASVVLRHICQLVCNGHAITAFTSPETGREGMVVPQVEERVATAIYPSASMMNHSCDPSITNSFYKSILIVRAGKDIKKGEEVFNCYGPHCRRMRRAERQEILLSQYHFWCSCSACTFIVDVQETYTALRCAECGGPSVQLSTEAMEILEILNKSGRDPTENKRICGACGRQEKFSKESYKKEMAVEKLLREGQDLLSEDENVSLALEKLIKSWRLGRQILYKFHKHLYLAADLIAKCLLMLGENRRSIMFLKCAVLSVEAQFGSVSIELATELTKLADSMKIYLTSDKFKDSNNAEDLRDLAKAAATTYRRADAIYKVLGSFDNPCTSEIESSLNLLKNL